MEFEELKNEIKKGSFDELRMDADNNFEAVVIRDEIEKLKERLEKFFGAPAFPSQNRSTFQMRQAIDGFGGIMPGQTLYFWSQGKEAIFALLWPWKEGHRITLKMIKR